MSTLTYGDVEAAAGRIGALIRPVAVAGTDPGAFNGARVHLAAEFMQHTGSFKARGAANFVTAHLERGSMPEAGVVIASGGNAGLACAWAAGRHRIPATVFVPRTAPAVKVARLRAYGAQVRHSGDEYAEALEASHRYAAESGALESHAYDHPLIAAGAGTLLPEILAALPQGLDTVIVSVGGGGLFAGIAAAAHHHGVRVVAVEPEGSRALNAAVEAGRPVDVTVESIAADSLGARRASAMALEWAGRTRARSLLVSDDAVVDARRSLWDRHRLAIEHGTAAAWAALTSGAYVPADGERVAVVLCGANTDPATLLD
ncbi:threonine/serine dehydratase [Streptosporangium sp. NPDC051022]|uniref:threonine/serine dehydratase n=1 Tax=Streptosporangium sp. NPDC051022 TaxID=3155752 RepID=UPI0034452EC9